MLEVPQKGGAGYLLIPDMFPGICSLLILGGHTVLLSNVQRLSAFYFHILHWKKMLASSTFSEIPCCGQLASKLKTFALECLVHGSNCAAQSWDVDTWNSFEISHALLHSISVSDKAHSFCTLSFPKWNFEIWHCKKDLLELQGSAVNSHLAGGIRKSTTWPNKVCFSNITVGNLLCILVHSSWKHMMSFLLANPSC